MEADELTLTRELETALSPCVAVDSRVVADAGAARLPIRRMDAALPRRSRQAAPCLRRRAATGFGSVRVPPPRAELETRADPGAYGFLASARVEAAVRGELELPTAYDQPRELTPRLAGVLLVGDAEALESWNRSDAQERELEHGDRRARLITAIATMQVSRHSLAET